jgi:hypothetical protein
MKPVEWFSREVIKHVRPVIRDFFINVYENPDTYLDPENKEGLNNQLIKFQKAIKKIPNWTSTQVKKQIDDIVVRCPGFKKLLVALFVSYIKMISDGIRTSTKSKRLDVKLPTDDIFIHTCFIDCAHDLYEDPYVMKSSESDRIRELDKRLQECISNSIDKLIPTMDIINNHIPAMGDDVSFTGKDDEDIEDISPTSTTEKAEDLKEVCDEDDDGEPKTIPTTTATASHRTTNGPPTEENKEAADDEGDEPDLFPDAPDKISSKE